MPTVFLTRRFASLLTSAACCLAFGSLSAQTPAQRTHVFAYIQSAHSQTVGQKHDPALSYPFPLLKTSWVSINLKGGSPEDRVLIDLEKYWKMQVPYKDQQKLVHRSAGEYMQYVVEHVNSPSPKAK